MKYEGMELESEYIEEEELERKLKKATHKVENDLELKKSGKPGRAKLLTQNMFLRPVIKTNLSDYKYERLEDFESIMDEFDIVCNQEVFNGLNSFKATLIPLAKKEGFIDFHVSSSPWFFEKYVIDAGLVILSRYPIVEKDEFSYSKTVGD